jgi:hypothetical protein
MLTIAVAIAAMGAAVYLSRKDAWERQQVTFVAQPQVRHTATTSDVTIEMTNTGNRPTVVHDIRLVGDDGGTLLSFRATGRSSPGLPVRLEAPDEREVRLDVPVDETYERVRRVEVDLLGDDKPRKVKHWPVLWLPAATARGHAGGIGILTVTPPRAGDVTYSEKRSK